MCKQNDLKLGEGYRKYQQFGPLESNNINAKTSRLHKMRLCDRSLVGGAIPCLSPGWEGAVPTFVAVQLSLMLQVPDVWYCDPRNVFVQKRGCLRLSRLFSE